MIPFALNILIFKASRGECQSENPDIKDVYCLKRSAWDSVNKQVQNVT